MMSITMNNCIYLLSDDAKSRIIKNLQHENRLLVIVFQDIFNTVYVYASISYTHVNYYLCDNEKKFISAYY